MKLPLSTELLFLIPLALALASGFFLYGIIIGLSIASALLYHFKNEKKYFSVDVVLSIVLILANLYCVYLSGFRFPYFHLATTAMLVSFYFWFRAQKTNYDFNHAMWHIASVMITVFCVLALS